MDTFLYRLYGTYPTVPTERMAASHDEPDDLVDCEAYVGRALPASPHRRLWGTRLPPGERVQVLLGVGPEPLEPHLVAVGCQVQQLQRHFLPGRKVGAHRPSSCLPSLLNAVCCMGSVHVFVCLSGHQLSIRPQNLPSPP